MGKIAFLFSGQGAQKAGMGMDFYHHSPAVRTLFDQCESLRSGTLEQCFHGTEAVLRCTENTQPCLYLADLGAAIALTEAGIQPHAVAGFSLGEIPALGFGGAFSYVEGFRIAQKRGQLMSQACTTADTSMMAVLRLSEETVEALCKNYTHLYPVNYNAPSQLTVAGLQSQLTLLEADVKKAGGRGLPVNVSGAFHSPYMQTAAEEFGGFLSTIPLQSPTLPVYSNITATPYTADVQGLMTQQIHNPVRWAGIMQHLSENGFDTFIEVGAGSVLKNLAKKNLPQCNAFAVNQLSDIDAVWEVLRP